MIYFLIILRISFEIWFVLNATIECYNWIILIVVVFFIEADLAYGEEEDLEGEDDEDDLEGGLYFNTFIHNAHNIMPSNCMTKF